MSYDDRVDAGRQLAKALERYSKKSDVLLFALPRGGVVVGKEVAQALELPLDVIVIRKIGAPGNEEYAIGAMAETGEIIWNEAERKTYDKQSVAEIVEHEKIEMQRRVKTYRPNHKLPDMHGKKVIIIDDGVATGYTMRAAVAAVRHQNASKVIIAVPHGASESIAKLRREVDEVICLEEPPIYGSVGQFYRSFLQTKDTEVLQILKEYGQARE